MLDLPPPTPALVAITFAAAVVAIVLANLLLAALRLYDPAGTTGAIIVLNTAVLFCVLVVINGAITGHGLGGNHGDQSPPSASETCQ